MQFTKKELNSIQEECNHYENKKAAVIEVLKIIQKTQGWVSDDSVKWVSEILHISESDIEGVATFYNQIFRKPVGRHIIRFCDSVVCFITGCELIQKKLEDLLNIGIGHTTPDNKFTLLPTCCLGMCNVAPVIMIDDNIYSNVIPDKIVKILRLYL